MKASQQVESKYFILLGVIIDDFPSVKQSAGVTLVYDDEDTIQEEWPDHEYVEVKLVQETTMDA